MGTEPFTRSKFDPNTGTGTSNPRQQVQENTSFIDASQVYGSDPVLADQLRTHSGGRLKAQVESDGHGGTGTFLPYKNTTFFANPGAIDMANDAHLVGDTELFVAGDRRANETTQLISMHTLFLREHNRIADLLHAQSPGLTDEQIYQFARRQVGAEMQAIVYNEWIPALLGPNALPAYTGYNSSVRPDITNEFSTSMFRFAHSQLDNDVERKNNDGTDIADAPGQPGSGGALKLAQSFFDPHLINLAGVIDPLTGKVSTGINVLVKAAASAVAQDSDVKAVSSIRNFLFGPEGAGGTDLIARDIQRGRDHGLTDYNSMRAAYGLSRVTSFAQITSNTTLQGLLQTVYGTVDNIDSFVGALAEDHVPGASVGPLDRAVLANQFRRLRDGDRFFFLNPNEFTLAERQTFGATTLAQVIRNNTAINDLQANVFFFHASISGTVFVDPDGNGIRGSAPEEPGLPGFTVDLLDDNGAIIASQVTDANGRYRFNEQDLNGTGNYTVAVELPAGFTQTAAQVAQNPGTILIDRGDRNVAGQNFAVLGTNVNFLNGFAGATTLQLNGAAFINGSTLRLTDGGLGEASSAFTTSAVSVTKFSTFFAFQLTNADADGFTFTIQSVGPTALGFGGGGLGYQGIPSSVAIKFDLFNNAGEGNNSVGLYFNGAAPTVPALDLTGTGINLHSGHVFEGRITYDGSTVRLQIDDTFTGAEIVATASNVNIPAVVGGNTAFVGFTAGTGGLTATQDILAWNYTEFSPALGGGGGAGDAGGADGGDSTLSLVSTAPGQSDGPVHLAVLPGGGLSPFFPLAASAGNALGVGQANVGHSPPPDGSFVQAAPVTFTGSTSEQLPPSVVQATVPSRALGTKTVQPGEDIFARDLLFASL
jgi:hypothetical protein